MEMKEYTNFGLRYIVRYPKGFTKSKQYPAIFCLHGAGGRGNNIDLLITNPFFKETEKLTDFPFVLVAPLCTENTWFDLFPNLKDLVRHTAALPFVDEKRLYMMGASMGGYATWQLAMSMPEYFAAIAPVCGGGMYWNAARLLNVPVWAFHGGKDPVVFHEESEKMVAAVNVAGGNARLTIYPENEHNAWTDTYKNPELFRWFLSNENQNATALTDKYTDVEIYG